MDAPAEARTPIFCIFCEKKFKTDQECDYHVNSIHLHPTDTLSPDPPSPGSNKIPESNDASPPAPVASHPAPVASRTSQAGMNPLFSIFTTLVARPKKKAFICGSCGVQFPGFDKYPFAL
ncbi:hypothetical protein JTE90_002351 [Oedothorax gibbosus]|uniref:C2H2-type domain-containing protein n=1 Tax=Oedothorax gibbosus TaxID=931172 RepID=A0AAV6ULS2_9ARAC|nr:hypothetical protein JTE90_002351 [Oedothorax gibbosus]